MLNADVICLTETHLKNDKEIEVPGFMCYVNNRKVVNSRIRKGSGGVAILIRTSLLRYYGVKLIDKECEGILAVELKNTETSDTIQVYCCYLPPIDSLYSNTSTFLVT